MDTSSSSILCQPKAIAILVNENAIHDLKIFMDTLKLWNTTLPVLYAYTTSSITLEYPGTLYTKPALDIYQNLSRQQMEAKPSQQGLSNFFHDFTVEKCSLMEWAIGHHGAGVLFCDADICWFGPLPSIPEGTILALSRHEIFPRDEKRFGTFNAGFLYMNSLEVVETWLKESLVSDFFEQLSLDVVAKTYPHYSFGSHINYGWWRMFQVESPEQRKADWSIHRTDNTSGLCVKGEQVVCIHTHWKTTDYVTIQFNKWILKKLTLLKKQKKVAELLRKLK
jgi:hypothetical protein